MLVLNLFRPVRVPIRAGAGDLPQPGAVAVNREDLLLAGAGRDESDMAAVRGKRRALVVADVVGERAGVPGREVKDLDDVAAARSRRVGNLVQRSRRPGRPVAVRFAGDLLQPGTLDVDDVDLGAAGAVGREG